MPDVTVHGVTLAPGLTAARTVRVAAMVLRGEGRPGAAASVTFLSVQRMRVLNRRTFRRDRATDVIAFGLEHDGRLHADVYVCPAVARRSAARVAAPLPEELVRLVVHGVLHATGWDHGDRDREHSPMWRRQERYVRRALRSA